MLRLVYSMRSILLIFFACCSFLLLAQTPIANFSALPLSVCAGVPVNFTNTSSANGGPAITSNAWDFGDGTAATTSNATHAYSISGTYSVTLVTTNANGNVDSEIKPNYITVLPSPNVGFNILGAGCTVPLTLTFNNTSSQGANYSYSWNFGNTQNSTQNNPASVVYNNAGLYTISLTVTNTTNGCSSVQSNPINISNFQTAINAPLVGCVGNPISFIDNSTAGANNWNWNVVGLGTSTLQNPSFTFTAPGTYTVQLSSQNTASGCAGSASQQITIQGAVTPSFTANPTTNCAPASINFTNTTGVAGTYNWTFGNGQTFTGQTPPAQVYAQNGFFDVTLSVTTPSGCSGSTTLNDVIHIINVQSGFYALDTGGCNPLVVQFIDTSVTPSPSNPIVSWQWNFGNGQTYNGHFPPPQTYPIGLFDVSLVVTTQSGCVDTVLMNDYITVGHIDLVNFNYSPLVSCAKTDIQFNNTSVISTPHLPNEVTYFWDFQEGNSTIQNPSYQFSSDTGYFDVTLIVNFRGCIDSLRIDSAVYILAPIAKFTVNNLVCNPSSFPVVLPFTDTSIHGEVTDNVAMTWEWNTGGPNTNINNATLDGPNNGNASHSFPSYGSYTVEQVIHNYTTGCSDSITQTINISQLIPAFNLSNDSVCKNNLLSIFDASTTFSTHPLVDWFYNTGNGNVIHNGPNPTYTYPTSGNYNITLSVSNSVGCVATISKPVKVLALPFGIMSALDDHGCSPFPVVFNNGSLAIGNGAPLSYFTTTFSDDSTTLVTNTVGTPITHTFVGTGIFYASMIATDAFGCQSSTANIPITITQPSAFYTISNVICNQDSVLTNNSSSGVGPISYEWLLEGNAFSTDTNALVSVSLPANNNGTLSTSFNLSLIVTDGNGCLDTLTQPVIVSTPHAIPNYTFSGAVLNTTGEYDCPPLFCLFQDSSESFGNITAWNWSFGNGNNSILENPSNTLVTNGSFDLNLSVTDQYGCTDDTTIINYVTIGGPQGLPDWIQNASICSQGANFLMSNPLNIDSLIWNMGDGNFIYNDLNFQYNYETLGTYSPSVTILNSDGCEILFLLDDISVQDDGLNALFTALPNPADINEVINVVDASTFAGSNIVSWSWNLGTDSTLIYNNNNPQSASFGIGGAYVFTLLLTDALGCTDTYSVTVNVNDPDIWVPNVFTPNGDGINDVVSLPFPAFKSYNIVILNRWGNVVVDEKNQTGLALWDGTDQGNTPYTDGVYFYHITGEMLGGTMIDKHGFISLIRSE